MNIDKNYVPYIDGNKTEINVKKQQEIEYLLEGTIKPKKGHFVWEINEGTGDIKKAQYKKDTIVAFSNEYVKEKLIINPDCIYIPALNIKNAKSKYLKNKEQSYYFKKDAILSFKDITF